MNRKKRTYYYHINFFQKYLDDCKKKHDEFEVVKTTYSRKICTDTYNLVFNSKGEQDTRVLSLINNVRGDAKKYMDSGFKPTEGHFDYFGLIDIPVTGEVICKVDIRSAYWTWAVNKGIISKETNNKMLEIYKDASAEELKQGRLKALGALATRKYWRKYKGGFIVEDEVFEEPTKDLYIEINRGIDYLMHEAAGHVDGVFYYYWDCLFMRTKFAKDAVDFFMKKQFEVKVESTILDFVKIGSMGYLICQNTNKIYMTGRESKHLIEHLI